MIMDHLLQRCSKNIKINHTLNKTLFMFIYIHVFKVYEETYEFVCLRSLSNMTKIRIQKEHDVHAGKNVSICSMSYIRGSRTTTIF